MLHIHVKIGNKLWNIRKNRDFKIEFIRGNSNCFVKKTEYSDVVQDGLKAQKLLAQGVLGNFNRTDRTITDF